VPVQLGLLCCGETLRRLTRASGGFERCPVRPTLLVTNLGRDPHLGLFDDVVATPHGYPLRIRDGQLSFIGDVAHESHQRVVVAFGDGARAALDYFYERTGAYQPQ
jgi:hypothetical protein